MNTNTRKIATAKTSVVLAYLLSSFGLATASGQAQNANCKQIQGSGTTALVPCSNNPAGLCAAGTVVGNDLVRGTTLAFVAGMAPSAGLTGIEPPSTISGAGQRTITTSQGTLSFSFVFVFDTARGEFAEMDRVTGGTGRFEGATGTLWLTGSGVTSFAFDFTGRICTDKP